MDGRFHGAWAASSVPGRTPRGCQGIWCFFIVRNKGFRDGAYSQYSLPGTCQCFLDFFFNHYTELCFQHYIGQDTQTVCIVSVNSIRVFWSVGVIFVSPFCQTHSDFLAFGVVSNGNIFFVPYLSYTKDKIYCFCKERDAGRKKQNTPLLPPVQ